MEIFLHLEMSTVFRRLQCCIRRYNVLQRVQRLKVGVYVPLRLREKAAASSLPVSDVITAGEVEMLQALEVRRRLGNPTVSDARTVAE